LTLWTDFFVFCPLFCSLFLHSFCIPFAFLLHRCTLAQLRDVALMDFVIVPFEAMRQNGRGAWNRHKGWNCVTLPRGCTGTDFDVRKNTKSNKTCSVSTPKATWCDVLYGKNNDRQWWRVVLDEAQMVADSSSLRSSNVADLESHSRWCVSGTPLNNNLEDFSGLLSFISRGTFNDNQVLKNEMLTPFRNRQPVGLRRMKGLLASIMWRHSKARVSDELDKEEFSKVPATVTNVLTVQFSPEER